MNKESLVFQSESGTRMELIVRDHQHYHGIPLPGDVAKAVSNSSAEWFEEFLQFLKRVAFTRHAFAIAQLAREQEKREGLSSAAELDEELQRYDDLAEKFGFDRENAFTEISSALERLHEYNSIEPPTHQEAVPVPTVVALDFMQLLEAVEAVLKNTESWQAPRLTAVSKKCREHINQLNGVLP